MKGVRFAEVAKVMSTDNPLPTTGSIVLHVEKTQFKPRHLIMIKILYRQLFKDYVVSAVIFSRFTLGLLLF